MITVPVLSTTEAITHALDVMTNDLKGRFETKVFTSASEITTYVKKNNSELVIIDFTSEGLRGENLYTKLKSDTSLKFLNILVIVADEGERMTLEMDPNPNLLLCINEREFLRNCTRIFKILNQNIQFLYNKLLQDKLCINGAGTFICDNDSADIVLYADLLVTYLTNTGKIDMEGKFLLQTSLMEMLLNALEHGNCNITYDEKSRWLESGHDILELISNRNRQPEINSKKITVEYNAGCKVTNFCIKDEGAGFDWRAMLEKDIEPDLHGMGIKMTERMVKELTYNEKGNEVYFSIENSQQAPKLAVNDLEAVTFSKDEEIIIDGASKTAFLLDGAVSCILKDGSKKEYLPENIFLPLYMQESDNASFKAEEDTRLMVIDKSLIDDFFKKEKAFKTLLENKLQKD